MIFGPSPLIDLNIVSDAPGAELQVDALPHLQHGESVPIAGEDLRTNPWRFAACSCIESDVSPLTVPHSGLEMLT